MSNVFKAINSETFFSVINYEKNFERTIHDDSPYVYALESTVRNGFVVMSKSFESREL